MSSTMMLTRTVMFFTSFYFVYAINKIVVPFLHSFPCLIFNQDETITHQLANSLRVFEELLLPLDYVVNLSFLFVSDGEDGSTSGRRPVSVLSRWRLGPAATSPHGHPAAIPARLQAW